MARTSCIFHSPKRIYLILSKDFLEITQDNHCEAALLALFEYWANGEIAKPNWDDSSGDPWIEATVKEIEAMLFGLYATKKIRESLKSLAARGFISIEKAERYEATSYRLNCDAVNTVMGYDSPPWVKRDTVNPDAVGEKGHGAVGENTHIKEEESVDQCTPENKPYIIPLLTEEAQEQNTNAIAEPGVLREIEFTEFDDWTNDGGDVVIAALRRQRGVKLTPKHRTLIREKLAMVPIREGLIETVAAVFTDWATEHHRVGEPQLICQGKWLKRLKGEAEVYADIRDLPSTPVSLPPIELQPISPKSPPDIPPASPHNGLPPLALRWNEVVHSGPPVVAWKEQSNGDFLLRTLMSDLAFQRESETALAKAEKLCAAKHPKGSYLTFGWFIKPGKWCEVLNGQHDWLLGDGPAQPKKSVFQQAKEQMRADREAKKADKNLDSGGG